jgi:hypothetical protein
MGIEIIGSEKETFPKKKVMVRIIIFIKFLQAGSWERLLAGLY